MKVIRSASLAATFAFGFLLMGCANDNTGSRNRTNDRQGAQGGVDATEHPGAMTGSGTPGAGTAGNTGTGAGRATGNTNNGSTSTGSGTTSGTPETPRATGSGAGSATK